MRRHEGGSALLEVLVALAILATAGLALLELSAEHISAVHLDAARESELWDEERLLAAHTLLSRPDLERRLGLTRTGDYVVSIQRPEPTLFRIAVGRVEASGVEDLVTVVYRPEAKDEP